MAGITAAVSLLGIPIYFYGKMTRLALLKWAPMRLAYEERPESNTGPLIPFLATCKENGSAGKSIILVHVLMEFLFCLLRFRTAFTINAQTPYSGGDRSPHRRAVGRDFYPVTREQVCRQVCRRVCGANFRATKLQVPRSLPTFTY
jgi:hypothetical protein